MDDKKAIEALAQAMVMAQVDVCGFGMFTAPAIAQEVMANLQACGYGIIATDEILTAKIDNLTAHKLGMVGENLKRYPSEKIGDQIDCGLVLRRLLEEAGFGIVHLKQCVSEENTNEK